MRREINEKHDMDVATQPAGGHTKGLGFSINWQKGPLMVDGVRQEPNGAFVEDVIAAALGRMQHYQASEFKCRENALAITKLEECLTKTSNPPIGEHTCPKCGANLEEWYDEEAGYGETWCADNCGWFRVFP